MPRLEEGHYRILWVQSFAALENVCRQAWVMQCVRRNREEGQQLVLLELLPAWADVFPPVLHIANILGEDTMSFTNDGLTKLYIGSLWVVIVLVFFTVQPAISYAENTSQQNCFDTLLMQNLANVPGGGTALLKMKQERDQKIGQVMQMIESGHINEARYMSRQWCLNIPDEMFKRHRPSVNQP
ncbi:MAG: hypothetical protein SFW62_01015 [Alphaproteobacteria bacterium]|nr:hypothetical protein [Alphaproteobacteria bacterium]